MSKPTLAPILATSYDFGLLAVRSVIEAIRQNELDYARDLWDHIIQTDYYKERFGHRSWDDFVELFAGQ